MADRQAYKAAAVVLQVDVINFSVDVINSTCKFSEGLQYLIIVLISLLVFLTVFGNILVMVAFIIDKRLRTQSNFFLLNLAICDLLLGAVAIPLYIPYLLIGKWMLGAFLCKLWLVVDYTMCTASAFNVALISYDRFLCVTMAVFYRSLQNRHSQTVLRMSIIWILSFLLYSPAILVWDSIVDNTYISEGLCIAGFHNTWYFLLVASSIGFAVPFISISFFNLSIYWNISKRSRKKRQSSVLYFSGVKGNNYSPFIVATNVVLSSAQSAMEVECKPPLKRKGFWQHTVVADTGKAAFCFQLVNAYLCSKVVCTKVSARANLKAIPPLYRPCSIVVLVVVLVVGVVGVINLLNRLRIKSSSKRTNMLQDC
ncbi:PREDICTED: histamine H3 receptor-like [Nanorana parkeri]|uniref:histamine H3 receptor-like n=1 Tax=Nanorana parkeri TaxID=125878 RepID=UPI000854235C|nr:PREDICTED: histamine H3 receptor-like [Nanorana parkeri]